MSDASFTKEEELQAYGGTFEYDVSIPLKVVVDFSEADTHWKNALREEVRKKVIEHIDSVGKFNITEVAAVRHDDLLLGALVRL